MVQDIRGGGGQCHAEEHTCHTIRPSDRARVIEEAVRLYWQDKDSGGGIRSLPRP
ncbi:MAG: hypothetical protein M5R42_12755 [Rhodocyclaceae bacterium]|nr:hypothetical protein [Rhodocyclaceae bacterium]